MKMEKSLWTALLLAVMSATPAFAKTIVLESGESVRYSELSTQDTVTCAGPSHAADQCKKMKFVTMKEMGVCSVCQSSVEGDADYWLVINGANTGTMYTSINDALHALQGSAYKGLCN
jgi:hypothetical protein